MVAALFYLVFAVACRNRLQNVFASGYFDGSAAYSRFCRILLGMGHISGAESALGAVGGYFLPVLVSLLFVWKNKDAFGGGDIKLLAALGAWLGFEKLLYVIVVSAVLFILYAAIKRQRSGAYGPAIAIAGIIVAFYFF